MRLIGRSSLRHVIPFTPLLAAAALSIAVAASDNDVVAGPADSVDVPAATAPTDANTLRPVQGDAQTIRVVEVDSVVSGSEPDPESFDRVGLERWWHDYRLAHSLRADNARR